MKITNLKTLKLVSSVSLLCFSLLFTTINSAKAHAGHDDNILIDYIGQKFLILANEEAIGEFTIKKVNRDASQVKIDHTFYREANIPEAKTKFTKISAGYKKATETLFYSMGDDFTSYVIWTDFSKLDGEDNYGVQISYPTHHGSRTSSETISIENIVVKKAPEASI